MSLPALLTEVRDYLRSQIEYLGEEHKTCFVSKGGQPFASSGELFVGVHSLDWANANPGAQRTHTEEFTIGVTITRRSTYSPADRQSDEVWLKNLTGIDKIARDVTATIIAGRQTIHANANANSLITKDPFVEVLVWQGNDPEPREVGPDWFWVFDAEPGRTPVGLVTTCRFGQATRYMTFGTGLE